MEKRPPFLTTLDFKVSNFRASHEFEEFLFHNFGRLQLILRIELIFSISWAVMALIKF